MGNKGPPLAEWAASLGPVPRLIVVGVGQERAVK